MLFLPPGERSGETSGPRPKGRLFTTEGLRGRLRRRKQSQEAVHGGCGQYFPSGSTPNAKLPSEGYTTVFTNPYQHTASEKTLLEASETESLGWLPQRGECAWLLDASLGKRWVPARLLNSRVSERWGGQGIAALTVENKSLNSPSRVVNVLPCPCMFRHTLKKNVSTFYKFQNKPQRCPRSLCCPL